MEYKEYVALIMHRLYELRKKRGWKQDKLATILHTTQSQLSKWENGHTEPELNLAQIASLLKAVGKNDTQRVLGLDSEGDNYKIDNITWYENVPEYLTPSQRHRVELGIQVFRKLLIDKVDILQLPTIEPFKTELGDLDGVYGAFKYALHTGALWVTDVKRRDDLEKELAARAEKGLFSSDISFDRNLRFFVADVPPNIDGTPLRAEFVALLAEREIFGAGIKSYSIALGAGYTVWRIAQRSILSGVSGRHLWIPLVGFRNEQGNYYTANQIVDYLSNLHTSSVRLKLPHKELPDPDDMWARVEDELNRTRIAILTVFGRGPRFKDHNVETDDEPQMRDDDFSNFTEAKPIYEQLVKKGLRERFAGEMLGLFFDKNGGLIEDDEIQALSRKAFSQINLKPNLRKIMVGGEVWIVASMYKSDAVLMTLKNALANRFVIDRQIAEYLISEIPLHKDQGKVSE